MKQSIKRAADQGTSKQAVVKRGKQASKTKAKNVRRNLTSVNLGLGFPKRLVTTHKYTEYRTLESNLGLVGVYRFSCNGLYDPNITGTGHQPMYFDNLSAIYNHYTVIGSKITVRAVPATATQGPAVFGIYINDDVSTTIADATTALEYSSGSGMLIAPGQSNPLTVVKTWSAKQTFGGSVLANDRLQGDISSNPAEQSYYEIVYQDLTTTATTSNVKLWVEVEYTAVWDELKDQPPN